MVAATIDSLSYGGGSARESMHSGFMELGLDSVDVVQLIDRLNARLPFCRLAPTAVFAHPSPAALAAHVWEPQRLRQAAATPLPSPPSRPAAAPMRKGASAASSGSSVLDEYQLWPHGYVAAATLLASRRALLVLAEAPQQLEPLAAATGANAGQARRSA